VTPAIRTRELTKDFPVGFWRPRPYRALDRLSIDVAPGDVFGFLGPNGAGKTTTLKLLMQLVFPTSGEAEILGRPVGDVGVRHRIGYLPENPYFYDHLTAEELLDYYARLFRIEPAGRRQRVRAVLDRLGIGAERRLQLRKFSKGMLQRVGLAQALLNEPDVIRARRTDVRPRPARPSRRARADSRVARSGQDDFLQFAHSLGCRGAVQPRGDCREGTAGDHGTPVRSERVRRARVGAGGDRRVARRARSRPPGRAIGDGDYRRSIRDRHRRRRPSRTAARRAHRDWREPRRAQSHPRDLEELFIRRVSEMGEGTRPGGVA
jgi:ABC-type lipoprotein export system ATPase subunit